MKRNIAKALMLIAILIMCTGCKDKSDTINNYKASLTSVINSGVDTWEVYKCYDDQTAIVLLNGKIQTKKSIKVMQLEQDVMQLPDVADNSSCDITQKNKVAEFTWDASLSDSAEYIKYLEEAGYTSVFNASTQTFIEIYMQKGDSIKRLIVTDSFVCVYDVANFEFKPKDIDNYIYEIGGNSNG